MWYCFESWVYFFGHIISSDEVLEFLLDIFWDHVRPMVDTSSLPLGENLVRDWCMTYSPMPLEWLASKHNVSRYFPFCGLLYLCVFISILVFWFLWSYICGFYESIPESLWWGLNHFSRTPYSSLSFLTTRKRYSLVEIILFFGCTSLYIIMCVNVFTLRLNWN